MTLGSVSILVIAICNVVWLLSVIIALALLRALARRDKSLVTYAPVEPREFSEPPRTREIQRRFLGHGGVLAEIPAGIGRLFQSSSADQAAASARSDPARD
jgi:hypothetical protein